MKDKQLLIVLTGNIDDANYTEATTLVPKNQTKQALTFIRNHGSEILNPVYSSPNPTWLSELKKYAILPSGWNGETNLITNIKAFYVEPVDITKGNIQKMLNLSTDHITPNTFIALSRETEDGSGKFNNISCYKFSNGFIVHIIDNDDTNTPEDLKQCLDLAREHDCEIILFDNMEKPLDTLPVYPYPDNI